LPVIFTAGFIFVLIASMVIYPSLGAVEPCSMRDIVTVVLTLPEPFVRMIP
jgi:hypothetical protein